MNILICQFILTHSEVILWVLWLSSREYVQKWQHPIVLGALLLLSHPRTGMRLAGHVTNAVILAIANMICIAFYSCFALENTPSSPQQVAALRAATCSVCFTFWFIFKCWKLQCLYFLHLEIKLPCLFESQSEIKLTLCRISTRVYTVHDHKRLRILSSSFTLRFLK